MRVDRAVLDLSALAAWIGIVPLEPPEVDSAIAPDATLIDLVDLLRTYHDHRPTEVHADLLAVSMVVDRWETVTHFATSFVDMACRHSEVGIADLACLGLAKAAKLPLITGVAELAGLDPDIAVIVLPRR